jgi:hypothetical protein
VFGAVLFCAALLVLHADTAVTLQVLLQNTGNMILQGVDVLVPSTPAVTAWACKKGSTGTPDETVLSSGTAFTPPSTVEPGYKLVCSGTFTFTQAVLDVDRDKVEFTPTVVTTNDPATVATIDSGSGTEAYGPKTTISVTAAPVMLLTVNSAGCTIPSIIPAGATSMYSCTSLCCKVYLYTSICCKAALKR